MSDDSCKDQRLLPMAWTRCIAILALRRPPSPSPIPTMLADLAATCMLLVTAYAQWRLSRETTGWRRTWVARILLALVGTLVGYLAMEYAPAHDDTSTIALFLIGFGQVHVPAAILLLFKAQRSARVS